LTLRPNGDKLVDHPPVHHPNHARRRTSSSSRCRRQVGGFELILQQLRHLITSGAATRDRLPAERDLAAQFGVGRTCVRAAPADYGILETHPQSGTVVLGQALRANNLIGNVLALDRDDMLRCSRRA
jgi:hypothetical protein